MKKKYILRFAFLSSLVCGATGVFAQDAAPVVKDIDICEDVFRSGAVPFEMQPENNVSINTLSDATSYKLIWFDNKSDADAAMTDTTMLETGKTTAPTLEELFIAVDMTDMTVSEWTKSLYVVTSHDGTVSPASEMKIRVNATPKLMSIAQDPVCMGPVDLTNGKYWNSMNGENVNVQITHEGTIVNPKAITQSGEYEIIGTFQNGCASNPLRLQVDIRNLSIGMDPMSMTCPGDNVNSEVKIDYTYNKDSYAAQNGDVKLSWTSKETGSTKSSQYGNINVDENTIMYQSGNFEGAAGYTYEITFEITDGYCMTSASQKVILGNGPVEGTFTWSENNNQSENNGKSIPLKGSNIDIYACGDIVNIDFSNVAMDAGSDVEWFKSNDYSMSPAKTGRILSFSKNDYGTYYVRYINGCYAYITVKIIGANNITVEPVNQTICAGEEVELKATVTPANAKIEWFDEDMTTSLGENPGLVSPIFDGTGETDKYTHKYWARPYIDSFRCPNANLIPLLVEVYRPLEGTLYDQTICDGQTVKIDAGSYGATTYIWIVDGDTIPGGRYFQVTPEKDTKYQVLMTRGICKAEDKAIVIVKTNPVILSIDSIDIKEREVVMDPAFGTPVFQFKLDDGEWTEESRLTELADGMHTIYVEDANGCSLNQSFIVNTTNDAPTIFADRADEIINVYTITGALVKSNVKRSEALNGLANGTYIVGDEKVIISK